MVAVLSVDICVIGAGSGGLSVAAGASQMGAEVVLVERGELGGDCLNTGCVPSKALLASGHATRQIEETRRLGTDVADAKVDAPRVRAHVRGAIAAIAPNDSAERYEGLGVTVIRDHARFTGPGTITAGGRTIAARRFVIATGAGPMVPPIPGLDQVPYLTNETVFDLGPIPEHLIVIGGGPIGMELADAHRGLGSEVTVLEMGAILPHDDPELVDGVRRTLRGRGMDVREGARVERVAPSASGVSVFFADGDGVSEISGTHLLVATGRKPTTDGLDLEKAGVAYDETGITVDRRLRTTNKKIFAIGDVIGGPQFTHVAGYHAGIVIKNALFRLPAKVDHSAVPRVTYTDPELAQVGLTEAEAKAAHGADMRVLRWPFAENDRAVAEGRTGGMIKVITTRKGRILGAGIVGAGAGDLIQPWILALGQKMKIGAMASMIAPYPTRGEISKRVAGSFFTPALFGERTRKIVRFLARFG